LHRQAAGSPRCVRCHPPGQAPSSPAMPRARCDRLKSA
jgi:hypothetical protein